VGLLWRGEDYAQAALEWVHGDAEISAVHVFTDGSAELRAAWLRIAAVAREAAVVFAQWGARRWCEP